MKSSGDFSNIQKQQFLNESNLFESNKLNTDNKVHKKNLSENLEKIREESKYPFVVDWQIPENR